MTYEETKLSVIIVNYNVKYFLEQCLYSVRAAVTGMDAEVFVVDNNSTDGSVEYLRPKFPEVVFIENKDNPGFAKANNQAIRQCTGEYVLLLNPDTVVGEESLRSLCFQMDEDPEIGAIGVKMLNGHGVFLPESKPHHHIYYGRPCSTSRLDGGQPRPRRSFPYSRRPGATYKALAGALSSSPPPARKPIHSRHFPTRLKDIFDSSTFCI